MSESTEKFVTVEEFKEIMKHTVVCISKLNDTVNKNTEEIKMIIEAINALNNIPNEYIKKNDKYQ